MALDPGAPGAPGLKARYGGKPDARKPKSGETPDDQAHVIIRPREGEQQDSNDKGPAEPTEGAT